MNANPMILSIINQKGGVGKTTTAVNMGAALAQLGLKVLVIDIDPQANLSLHLDVDINEVEKSIYNVLLNETPIEEVLIPTTTERLSVVPANIDLSGAEVELASAVGRESILKDALKAYLESEACTGHDIIIIDCPPSLGLLAINALTASSHVLIALQAEFFAMRGMAKLMDVIELVKRRLNQDLQLFGIVCCMYDSRTKLTEEVLLEVEKYFGKQLFESVIRKNVRLGEAPSHGKTIFEYDSSSHGSEDYLGLAEEFILRSDNLVQAVPDFRPQVFVEEEEAEEAVDEAENEFEDEDQLEEEGEDLEEQENSAPEARGPESGQSESTSSASALATDGESVASEESESPGEVQPDPPAGAPSCSEMAPAGRPANLAPTSPDSPVAHLHELDRGQAIKFLWQGEDGPIEGFVFQQSGQVYAYENQCAHLSLTLDMEDSDFFSEDGEYLVCKTHGASYLPETGECIAGPCAGKWLHKLDIEIRQGAVYLLPALKPVTQ